MTANDSSALLAQLTAIGDDEVLVRIVASGICHSDLHLADGEVGLPGQRMPLVLGHEGAGIVVKVGSRASGNVRVGDRVAVGNINSCCEHCIECREGRESHCKGYKQSGAAVNGAYGEYATIHSRCAIKIPDGVPFLSAAPIACAGHTVYSGVKELIRAGVRPGSWVAIVGVGGLGHLAIQYAASVGFHVIAVDVSEERLELAKKLGAVATFDARDKKLVSNVMRYTDGGCQGVVVTATAEAAFLDSVRMARPGGTAVWIALPPGGINLDPKLVVLKAVRVIGSAAGSRAELGEAYRLLSHGKVEPIVEKVSIDGIPAAWDRLRSGKFQARFVIEMAPELMGVSASLAPQQGRI
ncbi:alcohol dehydrogenase, propanol-preferring [Hyaloraphidium curvatum]|nr:alcohol dehydrogenase, propanol-preferring [Hyaloraphidium curvatum]